MSVEIIPTNTCPPDFAELASRSKAFAGFSSRVQLDVGDGLFVPAKSWPYSEGGRDGLETLVKQGKGLPYSERLSYEVHLMVEEPKDIGALFARAKAGRIMGHIEAFGDPEGARAGLSAWRSAGAGEVGLALLLDTPFAVIEPALSDCSFVQLMSIARLGYQGAPFESRIYERIEEVRALYPGLVIEVDGGVSESNIADLVRAGVTRFGVGSAISKAQDPKAAYEKLKKLAESAVSQ